MPQVFQVLKCFKCLIFQVNQTKKSNKWICKVCGEKQSVKRHYGIGTAKDCRLHVQKLNNLKGDKEESQFKWIDSNNSESEENLDDMNNIDNTDALKKEGNKNIPQESKWLAYIQREQTSQINDPMCLDNNEVFLELPKKRKRKLSSNKNKLSKISNFDERTQPSSNITSNYFHYSSYNNESIVYDDCNKKDILEKKRNKEFTSQANTSLRNKNTNFQGPVLDNKQSKWTPFIEKHKNDENQHHYCDEQENAKHTVTFDHKDFEHDPCKANNLINDYHYNKGLGNLKCSDYSRNLETSMKKQMFCLCDDSDLDEVLNI